MSFIKVGIYENLHFSKATTIINDKGSLELGFMSKMDDDAMLAAFRGNDTLEQSEGKFIVFPPNLVHFKDKVPKTAPELAADFTALRTYFLTYAKLFVTKEKAEAALGGAKMFDGLAIADSDLGKAIAQLTNETWMLKVYQNFSKKFIAFLATNGAFDGTTMFRHKFPRQSADKHYAGLPNSEYEIWVESMDVPKEASKVCWSEWEVKNNRTHGNPVASTKGKSAEKDTASAAALFNTPVDTAAAAPPDLFNEAPAEVSEKQDPAEVKSSAADLFQKKPETEA